MARITGSSDREKRKSRSSNRPITQGQNPQRSNRQGVSQATVSSGDNRTRTGTARVASGQEPPKPVTRQSRVNGRLKPGTDTRPSPSTRAAANTPSKPTGPTPYQVSDPWAKPVRPSIGNVSGLASSPNRPAASPKPALTPNSQQTARSNYANVRMGNGLARTQFLPNSNRAGTNLPSQAANALRTPRTSNTGSGGAGGAKPPVQGTPQAEKWLKEQLKARGSNSLKGSKLGDVKSGLAGVLVQAASDKYLAPLARQAGSSLGSGPLTAAGRFIDDRLPGVNSKDEAKRKDSTQTVVDSRTPKLANSMPSRPVGTRQMLNGKSVYWDGYKWADSTGSPATASKPTPPKAPKLHAASSPSSSSSGSSRSSGSYSMSSPVRTSSSKPAPTKKAAPGQTGDKNADYRSWAAANPMLAAKVKPGQAGYEAIKGTTPASSEAATAPKKDNLKISADTGKNFRTDIALLDKKKKK